MNPAELSLATISPAITNNVGGKTIAQASLAANGSSKIERVNLEPIYLQLKAALGGGLAESRWSIMLPSAWQQAAVRIPEDLHSEACST